MKRPKLITGLDIGSSKVSCAAGEAALDGSLKILSQAAYPARGVSRGAIVDFNGAVDSVTRALAKLGELISRRPEDIRVNINTDTIHGETARGMVPLSLRGREVTRADMERCVNAASTIRFPFDREIIHKIVHSFSIDDQPWIANPTGLYASRLACEIYVITANINQIQNLHKCLDSAGYNASELVYSGMADGMSMLDAMDMEDGALVLGIGAGLTEISIFFGGLLRGCLVLPIGAEDLIGDLKCSGKLNDIITAVQARIEEFSKKVGSVKSIILTGGATFNDAVVEALGERLSLPLKVGSIRDIRGSISTIDSMKALTAIGIVRYAHERSKIRAAEHKGPINGISSKVIDILNNYF